MEEEQKPQIEKDKTLYDYYSNARTKFIASIGIIITLLAVVVIFFISSLEGTSEIQASNYESAKILQIWRSQNGLEGTSEFPTERVDIISYDGEEYYFVETEDNWFFAYEGGLDYVFDDYKYYVLTGIVSAIAIFVSYINYVSSVNSAKQTERFMGALSYYAEKKERARGAFHLIPKYCIDKNKETRETTERDIVEEAGIPYEEYVKHKKDLTPLNLDKWQKKILKKIKKVKIDLLHSRDLLQEKGSGKEKIIRMLPMGEQEHQRKFLIKGSFIRIVTVAMSGVVVAFGVVLGNWGLGATYGFTVAMGAVVATIAGSDYVFNTLRNRYIGKADYLDEFVDVKDKYIYPEYSEKKEGASDEPKPNVDGRDKRRNDEQRREEGQELRQLQTQEQL